MDQGFPSVPREAQQLLRTQKFGERSPGTVLADFEMLLESIGSEGVAAGGVHHLLPIASLPELNARLSSPMAVAMKRPQQKSYPFLNGLYLLVRATGLVGVRGSGTRARLVVDPQVLASWRELNPTERYFTLLEAWLIHARPEMCGERANPFEDCFLFSVMSLYAYMLERPGAPGEEVWRSYYSRYQAIGCCLPLLALFGLVDLEQDSPGSNGEWRVRAVKPRPFGHALMAAVFASSREALLADGPEAETPEETSGLLHPVFGVLQPGLAPLFPEWRANLKHPDVPFRDGMHVFRASLGSAWRRVAVMGKMTLDQLAHAILKAFRFDSDHLYCFEFPNRVGAHITVNAPPMDDGPWTDAVQVGELPLDVGSAMSYVFDFGDNWRFKVELEEVGPAKPAMKKPTLLASKGEAPNQYPDWEKK